MDSGHLDRSPFPRRLLPKIQEREAKALSEDDAVRVASLPGPHGLACRIMLGTGVRWGELVALDSRHVQGGVLIVEAPKTKKLRRIPVPPALLVELEGHVGKLVPFASDQNPTFSRFVARHSGVSGFGTHQCRHTFAFRWLESGGNLGALQVAMGHAAISTTMIYAKPTEGLLKREAERLWGATVGA